MPAEHPAPLRRPALWILACYGVALAAIALWPTPVDRGIDPLLSRVLRALHAHGAPAWLDYGFVESAANVALFVPLGLMVVLLLGARRWPWGIVAGALVSGAIELCQWVFLPDRFATAQDVLANTAGAALGTLVALLLSATHAASRRRRG